MVMLSVVVGVDAEGGTFTPGSSAQLAWHPLARRHMSECRSADTEYMVQQLIVLS